MNTKEWVGAVSEGIIWGAGCARASEADPVLALAMVLFWIYISVLAKE